MNVLNRAIVGILPLVPKPVVRRFSSRYIAGENIGAAVHTIRDLNPRGMMATLDVLGEFITRRDEAEATCSAYEDALRAIKRERLDSNISVKLTSMGLLLDLDLCVSLLTRLATEAASLGIFVRIDMEDSNCTTRTLDVYRHLREHGISNIGIVLQAYMRRSMQDIEDLLPFKPNVRVCKGIYVEPKEIAYQESERVNENFALMVETLLSNGCYVGIATHDEKLVQAGYDSIRKLGLKREQYEFQMLLGVREDLRQSIIDAGHRLRVYVPFGASWYAYSVRRLKENPRIAGYVFKNLIGKISGNGRGPHPS